MIERLLVFTILISCTMPSQAEEFDVCKDMVIDNVTEMAFGQRGTLYTGEVVCYRDNNKTILKSKRAFESGKPIGRHICYDELGVPYTSVSYNHTKIKKHGNNRTRSCNLHRKKVALGYCEQYNPGPFWDDKPCKANNKKCIFSCE